MDALFSDICEKIVDKSAKNPFKTLHFIKKKRIIKETCGIACARGRLLVGCDRIGNDI